MERIFNETRISFSQLASQQDVSLSTVWRWCTRGVRHIRLESMNVGGRRYTTTEAFQRFLAETQPTIPTTTSFPWVHSCRRRSRTTQRMNISRGKASRQTPDVGTAKELGCTHRQNAKTRVTR